MSVSVKKLNFYLFCIAYFLLLSFSMLGHIPFLKSYLDVLTWISMALLLFSIFLQSSTYKKKELVIILILLLFSIILIAKNNDFTLFKIVLLLASVKNVSIKKCLAFDFLARLILLLTVLCLYQLKLAPDVTSYFDGTIRHSLGFTNPNSFGMHILIFCFDIIYLNRNKLTFFNIGFIILLLLFSDFFAGSRTVTFILVLTLLLLFIYKVYPYFLSNKVVKFLITNSAFICFVITMTMYFIYINGSTIGDWLNDVLSNRLYNIYVYSQKYDIRLLGNRDMDIGLTLDSTYAYLLYIYGVVPLGFFAFSFRKLFKKLYEKKKFVLIIIMLCFLLYGLSEKLWLSIDYNVFMLVFAGVIYSTPFEGVVNKRGV